VIAVKQLKALSLTAIRSKAALTASVAVTLPDLTAAAVATASALSKKHLRSSAYICPHLRLKN
jgi:hypothetical protein